jgi:hypothetical protein
MAGERRIAFQDHLGCLIGIDTAQWWRPTAANYFDRVSKQVILDALADVGGTELSSRFASVKKADLAMSAERVFSGTYITEVEVRERALAWVPEVMRSRALPDEPNRHLAQRGDGAPPTAERRRPRASWLPDLLLTGTPLVPVKRSPASGQGPLPSWRAERACGLRPAWRSRPRAGSGDHHGLSQDRPRRAVAAARITQEIVARLEAGTRPWIKPWRGVAVSRPLRACGTPYRGMNVFWLWMVADMCGYTSPFWMTYNSGAEARGPGAQGREVHHRNLLQELHQGS